MAIFVPNRARELGKKAFESSSKMIKKVHCQLFDQGHSLTSRGQGRIVFGSRPIGVMEAPGGFERCESKKDRFRVKKGMLCRFSPIKNRNLEF